MALACARKPADVRDYFCMAYRQSGEIRRIWNQASRLSPAKIAVSEAVHIWEALTADDKKHWADRYNVWWTLTISNA